LHSPYLTQPFADFSLIPPEDYKDLRLLSYTFSAIEQVNATNRSTRTQLCSKIGAILNGKRSAEGLEDMDDYGLWRRIQKDNARLQNMSQTDLREVRRVQWMVHETQKKHFVNWETFCVEYGFAAPAELGVDKRKHGHIVFHDPSRIIQCDEYAFALNGSDEKSGGRPPMLPSATSIQHDPGQSTNKTSEKCSVLQAVNFADEAFPPFFIFPTKAKQENVKIDPRQVRSFQQVFGQYGLEQPVWWDSYVAKTSSGGMQGYIWNQFITENLTYYYPDARDVPGKRVLIKADSGPGESNSIVSTFCTFIVLIYIDLLLITGRNFGEKAREFLFLLQQCGFYFYPGLPNGTELGQEMDQLFSKLKGLLYNNRDKLWRGRLGEEGEKAELTIIDVGHIMFGGDVVLPVSGKIITLDKAFEKGLTPDLIKGAREKCGYCPATRAALFSDRLRHEIVEDASGNIDTEADPYGEMLDQVEKDNHQVADRLIEKGYPEAAVGHMRIAIRRVTANQVEARAATITQAGSRARQDALMQVSTAGQFFHVTNGGWVMNCSDMLFAHERKLMATRLQKMLKEKEACIDFEQVKIAAQEFMSSVRFSTEYARWKVPDLKAILR
jgi:hypothetical protein